MSISEQHLTQLLREYEQRRFAAETQALVRKRQTYEQLPRLKAIDDALESFGLHAVQSYLKNGGNKEQVLASLKLHNKTLLREKRALLQAAGYPENYLDVHYTCSLCRDTGYVDGKKCSCLKQRLIDLAYDRSNIKSILQKQNFQTFNIERFSSTVVPSIGHSPRENATYIREQMLAYVEQFPHNTPLNLLFYGSTGTGKTFFCNCIAKALLDHGHTVLYLTAHDLCSAMEAYRFRDKTKQPLEGGSIESLIRDIDLLIIDDLGTEFNTALSVSDLFHCVNQRLQSEKATIISTNLGLSQIAQSYSDRMASRISSGYRLLKLYGPDLRLSAL